MTKKFFYLFISVISLTFLPVLLPADAPGVAIEQQNITSQPEEGQEILILDDEVSPNVELSYWKEFARMMFILGIILGVVLVIAWLLRNFLNTRVKTINENNIIKLIERRNLSQKSMLYLVEVYQKQYLIGDSATGGIQVIAECHHCIEKDLTAQQPSKTEKSSFFEILQKKLSEKNFRQKVK